MKPDSAFAALHRLRQATDRVDAMPEGDRLREALSEPWVDARFARLARQAMTEKGIHPGPDWTGMPPRAGETWVLACDRDCEAGVTGRLQYLDHDTGGHTLSADARSHVDRALRGLESRVALARRELTSRPAPERFSAIAACSSNITLYDGSLGAAACACVVSAQTRRPPKSSVAASAWVKDDGTLAPIGFLDEKIDALVERCPGVKTLVVARGQKFSERARESIVLIPCVTVTEALEEFGLKVSELPRCSIDRHLFQVSSFEHENAKPHSIQEWRELSWGAFQASLALQGHEGERVTARAWAALFALHAGDGARSTELIGPILQNPEALPVRPRLFAMIVGASNAIDATPDEAIARAQAAFDAVEPLKGEPALYGQALGTLGRAYMHRGDHREAELRLRAAVEFHESHPDLQLEGPRSRTYLGTCLRMAGRPRDALEVLDRALDFIREHDNRQLPRTTELYVQLERGRSLAALDELSRALEALESCCRGQSHDMDYPRLGALRGKAVVLRRLGRHAEADELLLRCLKVARAAGDSLLGRVAAVASGEALVSGLACSVDAHVLEQAWERSFHNSPSPDELRRVLSDWIY